MTKSWFAGVCFFVNVLFSPQAFAQTSERSELPMPHAYIDDDDQRPLADLRFDVEPQQQQNLRITVSAIGANVEPIAGFRGIRGTNRYTAEELELILTGQHVVEVITHFDDGTSVVGRLLEGKYGTLPERRLLPGGRIYFLARTPQKYPLELIVDPQTKSSGRRTTIVIVNGRARLRCLYEIVDGHVEGLQVQSLGHHSFLASTLEDIKIPGTRRLILTSFQETTAPVSEEEWNVRDVEGKWVLLSKDIANDPTKIKAWVEFLQRKKEFQLLEWMAIYIPDAFKSHGVGRGLAADNAPQWIRVATWHSTGPATFGHGEQMATTLLKSSPGIVKHWLTTHKEKIDLWEGDLSQTAKWLEQDKFPPVDASDYLPPLQVSDLFVHLTPGKDLTDFAERRNAEPGVVYKHQVIREIHGVFISGRRDAELLRQVRQLTKHPDNQIRHAAFLAHSYLLPQTSGAERQDDFGAVVDDPNEPAIIREAALLGFSYHRHPCVLLKLHAVAADLQHPAWNAAVSRLGDIGQGFSISLLQQLHEKNLSVEQTAILTDSLKRLTDRESQIPTVAAWDMARRIALAVFAGKTNDPNATLIREWVLNSKAMMTEKNSIELQNGWNLKSLHNFWLPTSEADFAKSYDELKSEVLK